MSSRDEMRRLRRSCQVSHVATDQAAETRAHDVLWVKRSKLRKPAARLLKFDRNTYLL